MWPNILGQKFIKDPANHIFDHEGDFSFKLVFELAVILAAVPLVFWLKVGTEIVIFVASANCIPKVELEKPNVDILLLYAVFQFDAELIYVSPIAVPFQVPPVIVPIVLRFDSDVKLVFDVAIILVAFPCNEPVNAVDVTDTNPTSDVDVPPNVVDVEPIVIVLLSPNCDPSICDEPLTTPSAFNFDLTPLAILNLKEFTPYGKNFFDITCDITNEKNVEEAFERVIELQGKVDILINNASIDHKVPSDLSENRNEFRFENFDFSSWHNELAVGLTGAVYCCKYAARSMIKNESGIIINISSDLGVIAPDHRIYKKSLSSSGGLVYFKPFSYSVIKHGLIGLTKYLATYLADFGIRVNTLSPGSIFNDQDPEFLHNLKNKIPLGRLASVNEYKGAIQFLATDASSYMTGQNLIIDGGRSTW
jgi:NAD(P)-dependent dehydrogenase (short-subunit alcohol dehydrogenase family)